MTEISSAALCSQSAKNARRVCDSGLKRKEFFSTEKEGQQMLRLAKEFVSAALSKR